MSLSFRVSSLYRLLTAAAVALAWLPADAGAVVINLPTAPVLGPVLFDSHDGNAAFLPGSVNALNENNIQFAASGQACNYRGTAGVGSGFICGFDNLANANFVRFEQQIFNPNAFVVSFGVGLYFPDGGSPILGTLTLGAGSSFVILINVNDNGVDAGFQTVWNYNATAFDLNTSVALVEDRADTNLPGSFAFAFFSDPENDSFVENDQVTPEFGMNDPSQLQFLPTLVPEPATLAVLAAALAGLALFRRRRAV